MSAELEMAETEESVSEEEESAGRDQETGKCQIRCCR